MELIKDIAAVIGCISAFIALVTTIFKPVRKKIVNWIKHTSEASETSAAVKEINTKITALESNVGEILERIDKIDDRIKTLDKRVFENERDRIKAELSEYASRCARGIKIYPEEMTHINEIYYKYHEILGCNSFGTKMYDVIVKYYESQEWLKG
jgi:hypothetical protein